MLDALARWTLYAGSFDMAAVNFCISFLGALAALFLMTQVSGGWCGFDLAGALRLLQRLSFALLAGGLAYHASYPVYVGAQPWLPGVLLAASITFMLVASAIARYYSPLVWAARRARRRSPQA